MSLYAYLASGLVTQGGLRSGLEREVVSVADAWTRAGISPSLVEILGELCARAASVLPQASVDRSQLLAGSAFLDLPAPLRQLLDAATVASLDPTTLAALAVHLVDIAEAMAIGVYVPELPALSAKADRTGDAARSIGVAKHLKG